MPLSIIGYDIYGSIWRGREEKTDDYYVHGRDECGTGPAKANNPLKVFTRTLITFLQRFITTPGFFAFPNKCCIIVLDVQCSSPYSSNARGHIPTRTLMHQNTYGSVLLGHASVLLVNKINFRDETDLYDATKMEYETLKKRKTLNFNAFI